MGATKEERMLGKPKQQEGQTPDEKVLEEERLADDGNRNVDDNVSDK
jgi:hypothetical protein